RVLSQTAAVWFVTVEVAVPAAALLPAARPPIGRTRPVASRPLQQKLHRACKCETTAQVAASHFTRESPHVADHRSSRARGDHCFLFALVRRLQRKSAMDAYAHHRRGCVRLSF